MSVADLSSGAWLAIAIVIVLTILQILRFLCEKIAHDVLLYQLTIEARLLRQRYVERMEADRIEQAERAVRSRQPHRPPSGREPMPADPAEAQPVPEVPHAKAA